MVSGRLIAKKKKKKYRHNKLIVKNSRRDVFEYYHLFKLQSDSCYNQKKVFERTFHPASKVMPKWVGDIIERLMKKNVFTTKGKIIIGNI